MAAEHLAIYYKVVPSIVCTAGKSGNIAASGGFCDAEADDLLATEALLVIGVNDGAFCRQPPFFTQTISQRTHGLTHETQIHNQLAYVLISAELVRVGPFFLSYKALLPLPSFTK